MTHFSYISMLHPSAVLNRYRLVGGLVSITISKQSMLLLGINIVSSLFSFYLGQSDGSSKFQPRKTESHAFSNWGRQMQTSSYIFVCGCMCANVCVPTDNDD